MKECRKVEQARGADDMVRKWLASQEPPKVSSAGAARLVARARQETAATRSRWMWALGITGTAAAAATALVALVVWHGTGKPDIQVSPGGRSGTPPRLRVLLAQGGQVHGTGGGTADGTADGPARVLSVPGPGRLVVALNGDRIGLQGRTHVEVLRPYAGRIRIRLRKGAMVVAAAPRRKGHELVVEAAWFSVRVVGTRFRVALASGFLLQVSVSAGQVEVTDLTEGGRHQISRGETLRFIANAPPRRSPLSAEDYKRMEALLTVPPPALSRPPAMVTPRPPDQGPGATNPPPSGQPGQPGQSGQSGQSGIRQPWPSPAGQPGLKEIRAWILAGRLKAAERALAAHLARAPRDPRYWSVLAVCRRKAGNWPRAVAAYRKVIKLGRPKASNRARFQAAVLLQDRMGRHRAAATLLRGYLNRRAGLRPLTSEARIRRARSLVASGQTDGARRALLRILRDHAGTTAAIQARRLLRKIGRRQTKDENPPKKNKLPEKK